MKTRYLYLQTVHLYIIIYLCYLICTTILFINILFGYNTLLTYTNKNILLISGITFSVFTGPDEQFQVPECPVAVWSVIRDDHISSQHKGSYVLMTANVTQIKPDLTR